MLEEVRDHVREARRTDPKHDGLSARRRWVAMAFDQAVKRLREVWDEEWDDELLD